MKKPIALLWSILVVTGSCGRRDEPESSLEEARSVPLDLTLGETVLWEGTLEPAKDYEAASEAYALDQDFLFIAPEGQAVSFVKLAGSSVCGGESGLSVTDYQILGTNGEVLERRRFHPARKIYPLGQLADGPHVFRLTFRAPAACSIALKFALVPARD